MRPSRPGKGIDYLGGEERTNYPFALSVDDLGDGFVLTAQVRSPLDPDRICAFVHTALEKLASAWSRAGNASAASGRDAASRAASGPLRLERDRGGLSAGQMRA